MVDNPTSSTGGFTSLGSDPGLFPFDRNRWLTIKVLVEKSRVSAKLWHVGDPEPSNWLIAGTSGEVGGFDLTQFVRWVFYGGTISGIGYGPEPVR